jgi:hypothetical protein
VDHNRTVYRNHVAAACAHLNRPEEAVTEAFGILADSPTGFHMWAQLVDCLDAGYGPAAIEVLAPLAAKDPTGGFLEPVIRRYPTEATARFCALYSSLGGAVAEAIRVGLLAAAMSSGKPAFTPLARAADRLEPATPCRAGKTDNRTWTPRSCRPTRRGHRRPRLAGTPDTQKGAGARAPAPLSFSACLLRLGLCPLFATELLGRRLTRCRGPP